MKDFDFEGVFGKSSDNPKKLTPEQDGLIGAVADSRTGREAVRCLMHMAQLNVESLRWATPQQLREYIRLAENSERAFREFKEWAVAAAMARVPGMTGGE
jgi:hypothetical protein